MFRRRVTPSLLRRLAGFFWPSLGWSRFFSYLRHRLGRMAGSPHSIAVGLACGAAFSFTPLVGVHILGAVLLAWILRGSIVASVIGTAIGNPWTFPLIWAWLYVSGSWVLGREAIEDPPDGLTLSYIRDHFWKVFLPMTVSGVPTALLAWLLFFLPVRRMVEEYQRARRWRMRKKVIRRRKKVIAAQSEAQEMEGQL